MNLKFSPIVVVPPGGFTTVIVTFTTAETPKLHSRESCSKSVMISRYVPLSKGPNSPLLPFSCRSILSGWMSTEVDLTQQPLARLFRAYSHSMKTRGLLSTTLTRWTSKVPVNRWQTKQTSQIYYRPARCKQILYKPIGEDAVSHKKWIRNWAS